MRGKLTLSAKVGIATAVALLVVLAVGATAFVRTQVVARRVERFAGEQFPDALLLSQIAQGRLEVDLAANAVLAAAGRAMEPGEDLYGDVDIALTVVDEGLKSYESRPRPAELRAEWDGVALAIDRWRGAVQRVVELTREGASHAGAKLDPASDAELAAWREARKASREVESALLSYMTKVAAGVQQVRQESTSSTRIALWLIGLAMLAGASGLVAGGLFLQRSVARAVAALAAEAGTLEQAVANGQLDVRGDPATVSAEFRPIVEGMNKTLDAFVSPLRLAAGHIDRIARGDIPECVSGEYRGEFETIKANLNRCSEALRLAQQLEVDLRQAQKLEAVGRLAAGIAHEINTPIQFVGDSTRFLEDAFVALSGVVQACEEAVPPEALDALHRLQEEADLDYLREQVPKAIARTLQGVQRVATIVGAMKEFAHPDRKEMVATDLNRAIQATLEISRNEYKYVAEVHTDLGELPLVMCHAGDLNQVVLNLVVNAAHAIADVVRGTGEMGRIRVATRRDGGDVTIAVSDTGAGIPDAIRDRVFDPFFTTKEVGRGTGQGLAIARSIVSKHRGTIHFESEQGKGTTFFIRVPLSGGAPPGAGPTEPPGARSIELRHVPGA
jgi:signal transduction histidine kinase